MSFAGNTVVITQLVVDASGAKTGVAEFEAALAKAKAAANDASGAVAGGPNSFDGALKKWTQSLAAADPVLKAQIQAQKALQQQTEINTRAVALGITTQDAANDQLDKVRQKFQGHVDAARAAANENSAVGKSFGFIVEQAGPLIGLLSAAAIVGFAKSTFENAAALQSQAAQAGVNVEAFQAYQAVMKESGIANDDAAQMIGKLTHSIGDARNAAGPARDAFNQLGIGAKDLTDGVEGALPKIAEALLKIPDATERARLEADLFGRTGQKLESALRVLIEPTADLIAKEKALGQVLGEDVTKGADDAANRLDSAWKRIKDDVTPVVVELAEKLADLIDTYDKWADRQGPMPMPAATQGPTRGLGMFGSAGILGHQPVPNGAGPAAAGAPPAFSNDNETKYLAAAQQAADLAGLTVTRRAQEVATIGLANAKLQDGTVKLQDQNGHLIKQVANYAQARELVGATAAKHVESLAAITAQGAQYDKLKETFKDYLDQLAQAADTAGLSTAEQQEQATVIQAANAWQRANGVEAKNLDRSYGDALHTLQKQGELLPVLNDLERERTNELKRQNAGATDNLDYLNAEIALVGKSNIEQATALALLRAQQDLKGKFGAKFDPDHPTDEQQRALDLAKAQAEASVTLTTANDNFNQSLRGTADLMSEIAAGAKNAAAGLADSFGKIGKGIGAAASAYAGYQARLADFSVQQKQIDRDRENGRDVTKDQITLVQAQGNAEAQYYSDTIEGLKGMFGQKTAIYAALNAAEQIYNAIQIANSLARISASIFETGTKTAGAATVAGAQLAGAAVETGTTAVSVANAATEATAWGVTGIAKAIASLPFPFDLAAGAAVAAALVGFGVAVFGGGGGGPSAADIAANDPANFKKVQEAQGAGTVLGDASAKSDSIQKSLDALTKNANTDLNYSNQMVVSLRSIDTHIGNLTALLAQQLSVGGLFDTSALKLGTNSSGVGSGIPLIGGLISSLFGSTKTTTTLLDQGIGIDATTIGKAIADGIAAHSYQTVQTTQKNSSLFGLISSTKTSNSVSEQALGSDFTGQIAGIIGGLRNTVLDAAARLGIDGAQAVVDAMAVNIGSFSLKDMTGQQIQDALNAEFGKLGDQIAAAAIPSLSKFQQVGEGAFTTLARLVAEYQAVDDAQKIVGFTFSQTGLASLAARDNLVQLVGGLDSLETQASAFAQEFLTTAQQIAPIAGAVSDAMGALGFGSVTTKAQFASLVQGLDVSTDAGAQLYAQLMNIAPAFGKVADAAQDLSDKRTQLQITLLEDQGDATGALALKRQQEIAALDDSLVALQQQIYAQEDANSAAAAAADQAKAVADALAATTAFNYNIGDSILKITNPALATYNELLTTQAQRIKDAAAVGGDLNQVYQLNALELDQLAQQTAAAGFGEISAGLWATMFRI
jgi:hypothetical protein